mgnify:CR=1 FL=1
MNISKSLMKRLPNGRHAVIGVPFFWLPDLSRPDPVYIIPILMGLSMFALSKVGQIGVPPNPQTRSLLNKESKLQYGPDGSLTLYFGDKNPADAPQANWLPTPTGVRYSLTFRFYRPKGAVAERSYFPPKLEKQ